MPATIDQLQFEVDDLTRKVTDLSNLLALLQINGLNDAFDGSGDQTFGGGFMRLNKRGEQFAAPSVGDTVKAIFFVAKLVVDPTAETRYSWIDGYVGTGETGIAMNAIDGSTAARMFMFANAATPASWVGVEPALRLQNLTADPSYLADGLMWYRSDLDTFRVRANGATKTITVT